MSGFLQGAGHLLGYLPSSSSSSSSSSSKKINSLAFWDNFRLHFFLGLFYSIYLGPETRRTPNYGRERMFFSFFGAEVRLQLFYSSRKA